MNKKMTLPLLILGIIYCFICFLIIGLVIQIVIAFMNEGSFLLSKDKLIDTLVFSGIAGVAAGSGAWIFARIDEYKSQKSPPSDPKS